MKILSLGLDSSILDKNSHLARRAVEYGEIVDKYDVVVPGKKDNNIKLSDKVDVYSVGGAVKPIKLVKLYKLAKKVLNKEKYDIITVQDQYYLGLIGLCLARKFKVGLEVQVHGFEKYSGLRKIVAKYVITKANAIRVVSQRLKKKLVSEFGVDEEKITVVPIFSDIGYRISDIGYDEIKNKFIFLTVGRLVEVKNIGMMIKAMAKIVGTQNFVSINKKIELWIVGEGPLISDLRFQISDLKLEEKVKLLGWQNNLGEFYKKAGVFLLTSDYEGWGLAVIDAASFGLPIIMTDVGCAGEVIKDGESGIVIPIGDQEALEKAMVKLAGDADLRKKLGHGARQAVEKLPSKEETLGLYLQSWHMAKNNT